MNIRVPAGASEMTVEATIIRKDGRIERLGTIAYWHRNPIRRLAWRLSRFLKV